jgi:hypothetical protein
VQQQFVSRQQLALKQQPGKESMFSFHFGFRVCKTIKSAKSPPELNFIRRFGYIDSISSPSPDQAVILLP